MAVPCRRPTTALPALAVVAMVAAAATLSGAQSSLPQFVDIAAQAGIRFHHTNGASPDKHLVETM